MIQTGRLAIRKEGQWVNAYYALPDTMKDALPLGMIRVRICDQSPDLYDRWKQLMKDAVGHIVKDVTGIKPEWSGEERAPEHERAGEG
jgi:hypothetical protein